MFYSLDVYSTYILAVQTDPSGLVTILGEGWYDKCTFSQHDIGIARVTLSRTVIGPGSTLYISVKILNYGLYDETFTITIHANAFVIVMQTIAITKRNSISPTFAWNTTSFAKSSYTMIVVVDTVPDETDAKDIPILMAW
jgi:hypothetical protein